MLRCLSGSDRDAGGNVLKERASILGASDMLAVLISCGGVQVEDFIVNGCEGVALGGAVAATCRHCSVLDVG